MADHSQTVTNSLNLFGGSPSNKWGVFNWGAFLWGEGTADLPVVVVRVISASLGTTSALGSRAQKLLSGSLSLDGDMSSEALSDGSGYTYIFPSNASNLEDRDPVTWSSGSAATDGWSSGSDPSTTWS